MSAFETWEVISCSRCGTGWSDRVLDSRELELVKGGKGCPDCYFGRDTDALTIPSMYDIHATSAEDDYYESISATIIC